MSLGVSESRQGGDEIGLIMAALFFARCVEAVLLWTRRRLVKQRHTKALETAGYGPFSTVCHAANIHHLLQAR